MWTESFLFDIYDDGDTLKVTIKDKYTFGKNLGRQATVGLDELRDQMKEEKWMYF